jgi:hypothetical protein
MTATDKLAEWNIYALCYGLVLSDEFAGVVQSPADFKN